MQLTTARESNFKLIILSLFRSQNRSFAVPKKSKPLPYLLFSVATIGVTIVSETITSTQIMHMCCTATVPK